MEKEYDSCILCPRNCKVNRNNGEIGYCGETSDIRLAWAGLHFGEEPPVIGKNGSGTLFISGCNLGCTFCQNYQISQQAMGKIVSREEFAQICNDLEKIGAENINIVTGSHAIPAIATALRIAQAKGLSIPVLWNTSSYETPEAINLLSGLVTVWLPDLKTLNPLLAEKTMHAPDYPKTAKKAIKRMAELSPLIIEKKGEKDYPEGKIVSGVILRHLALPGKINDSALVLHWFSKHLKDKTILSLMTQYTPVVQNKDSLLIDAFPNRMIQENEFLELTALLEELEIDTGYFQELIQDTDWLPDFSKKQPFSSELAQPCWHWKNEK